MKLICLKTDLINYKMKAALLSPTPVDSVLAQLKVILS